MKFFAALLCLLLLNFNAEARPRGITAITTGVNTGGAIINLGEGQLKPAFFTDIMKATVLAFSGGATPGSAQLDDKMIPTTTFTGTVVRTVPSGATYSGNYTLGWSTGTKIQITNIGVNSNCIIVSGTSGSFSGCSGGNATFTIDGTGSGSISFDTAGFSMQFPGTYAWGAANTANFYIVKTSELATYLASSSTDARKYFSSQFLNTLLELRPSAIRTMGWSQVSTIGGQVNTDVEWINRTQISHTSWIGPKWPLKFWSGGAGASGTITRTASGTCNGSGTAELYTANATIDNPAPSGTPAYGTIIQGVISEVNTTTSPSYCLTWSAVFPDGRVA